jgi:hypothetical protein
MLNALQVVHAVTGTCYRPYGFFGIIFAVADPGQANLGCLHQNLADCLQYFLFTTSVKEFAVASTDGPQAALEARHVIPNLPALVVHLCATYANSHSPRACKGGALCKSRT